MGLKRKIPQSNEAQPLRGANHKRIVNQKTAHAVRGQRWTTDYADKPLDHSEHMNQQADFGHPQK